MRAVSIFRSIIGVIIFLAGTVLTSSGVILLIFLKLPRDWVDRIICWWAEVTLLLFGIKVIEFGRENIPDGACLFLFNHTSFFDVFVMAARLPGMRFGAKSELFKIPFFGKAMKMAGVLPITRNNREKVLRVYDRAKVKAQGGQQYALAPEGGRNSQEALLPFKSGPFIFAIKSGLPVVPVVIRGAHAAFPKDGILPNWKSWHAPIELHYLQRISTESFVVEERAKLQSQVYSEMKPYFS